MRSGSALLITRSCRPQSGGGRHLRWLGGIAVKTKLSERIRPDCEAAPWVCREIEQLERELAEAKARAVIPDGCIAVNREKLERIADAIFSKRHNAQENGDAYDVGYFGKMLEDLEAMLSSGPDQKESSDAE